MFSDSFLRVFKLDLFDFSGFKNIPQQIQGWETSFYCHNIGGWKNLFKFSEVEFNEWVKLYTINPRRVEKAGSTKTKEAFQINSLDSTRTLEYRQIRTPSKEDGSVLIIPWGRFTKSDRDLFMPYLIGDLRLDGIPFAGLFSMGEQGNEIKRVAEAFFRHANTIDIFER